MLTVLDVAGARSGGAARWRVEARKWVRERAGTDVLLLGMGEQVEPRWLVRRELVGWTARRIAANNVSFVGGRGPRIVLLRNALHFLREQDFESVPEVPASVRLQALVVRATARRADVLVVPCSDMADRVRDAVASGASRIVVRHHPLTAEVRRRAASGDPYILYPSIPARHKDLTGTLGSLVEVLEDVAPDLCVRVTAPAGALGALASHSLVRAVGVQDLEAMDNLRAEAEALYAPSKVESFGYPVAEARAAGVPVIAVDTPQNREIAGRALFGYKYGSRESLASAVEAAITATIEPEPRPFDPDTYFSWLTSL